MAKKKRKNIISRLSPIRFIRRHKKAFLIVLIIVFVLSVFISRRSTKPDTLTSSKTFVTPVDVFTISSGNLSEKMVGTVKNTGSLTLVAQQAGPVSKINYSEGDKVTYGASLVNLSSAYASGNAMSVSRQVAQKNVEISEQSLKSTIDIVSRNREIADKNRENSEELRKISSESVFATQNVINTSREMVVSLQNQISQTSDETLLATLKGQLISYMGVLHNSENALRNLNNSVDKNGAQTAIADSSLALAYESTELQLKTAQLSLDIAKLNLSAAKISEAMTRVSAPFSGRIERIFVNVGQYVTPGTPVVRFSGEKKMYISVSTSSTLAARVSENAKASVVVGGKTVYFPIRHVSNIATNGQAYEILIDVPNEYLASFSDDQSVEVSIPLVSSADTTFGLYIPLDSVYVTNTRRYVYVVVDGKAQRRDIGTGEIVGNLVEVLGGLGAGDSVILQRNIREGEEVAVN